MKILFLHPNFPAQFRHLATILGQDKQNTVVYATNRPEGSIAGVNKVVYEKSRTARPETHHYVRPLENAVLEAQGVYRVAQNLKDRGFYPDVVYGHSGWGPTLFMKDIFPKATLLCYFEWYYNAYGSDANFDPSDPINADDEARIRTKNAPILLDLASCDRGLSPTSWQRSQFPQEFQSKIKVHHDGIDTTYFKPVSGAKLKLPRINLDLTEAEEVVTYVRQRNGTLSWFSPADRSNIFVTKAAFLSVILLSSVKIGVAYGKALPDGRTYKDAMLEKFPLDLSRVHFTGLLPYGEYLQVLQASSVHVYLTRPFVLSWSMLEALSAGCLIVASDTAPVKEVIEDSVNGLLVDFFSPQQVCDRVIEALDSPEQMANIRVKARETILEKYDLGKLLPQHLQWVKDSVDY